MEILLHVDLPELTAVPGEMIFKQMDRTEAWASCRREGGMQHIAEWLEGIGLSEYLQRFVENGIDVSVLPHLTDQDLKELGVSLGHRRKMLRAIAEMGAASSVARDNAERRQLTLMFCDLVDSTSLSTRLELEDFRKIRW